ncbi:hotdog family protein [Sinobacterium norvegicum]|nr:hotdog family protein [Sinobacterium norvegicum]
MSNYHIEQVIPHRPPMVLLDRLDGFTKNSVDCSVTVTESLAFADRDGLPAWVGLEIMAQSVAAWSGATALAEQRPIGVGFLLGTRKYRSHTDVFPLGSELKIHGQELLQDAGMSVFECTITLQGEVLAEAKLTAYLPDEEQLNKMIKGD